MEQAHWIAALYNVKAVVLIENRESEVSFYRFRHISQGIEVELVL